MNSNARTDADAPSAAEVNDRRRQQRNQQLAQIEKYRQKALSDPDPQTCILGCTAADLLEFASYTTSRWHEVGQALDATPDELWEMRQDVLGIHLPIVRQADRLMEFDQRRLEFKRQASRDTSPANLPAALPAPAEMSEVDEVSEVSTDARTFAS